ncbi:MAG: cytochrome P450 [Actinobacteria bacterium]|nr:cytochrome P450 [Actinomycetota bacterium]
MTVETAERTSGDEYEHLFVGLNAGLETQALHGLWGQLENARAASPVIEGRGGCFAEVPDLPNVTAVGDGVPTFLALTFETVGDVLRDAETYSSEGSLSYDLVFGKTMVNVDDPAHAKLRSLIMPVFRRSAMERWQLERIAPVVEERLGLLRARERAELMRTFVFPVPFVITSGVVGLPEDAQFEVTRLVNEILNMRSVKGAMAAAAGLELYMRDLVAARKAQPVDDMVSELLAAEIDGDRLTDQEVIDFLRLLGPAAMDTTYRATSILLFALLTHPDQLAAIRERPDKLVDAIEESLRWESVGSFVRRQATKDTELAGVRIPEGAAVLGCLRMANRDPDRWNDPHEFRFDREPRAHYGFGAGPHTCLGLHLARQTMTHAVSSLITEFPNLRLDPEAQTPVIDGLVLRAASALPVILA